MPQRTQTPLRLVFARPMPLPLPSAGRDVTNRLRNLPSLRFPSLWLLLHRRPIIPTPVPQCLTTHQRDRPLLPTPPPPPPPVTAPWRTPPDNSCTTDNSRTTKAAKYCNQTWGFRGWVSGRTAWPSQIHPLVLPAAVLPTAFVLSTITSNQTAMPNITTHPVRIRTVPP